MACQSLPPIDPRRRAQKIKCGLKSAGLTLERLSILTAERYGRSSPYFIPPTFCYKLAMGVTPHICQIAALSAITKYPFTGWMTAFGFDLAQIPRLQVKLHHDHTVLVTPLERDTDGFVSRQDPRSAVRTFAKARPSPHWERKPDCGLAGRYLYAKIGTADTWAFPELVPGSIVRVDTRNQGSATFGANLESGPFYLVEHVGGLTCCRVKQLDDRHILLLSRQSTQSSFPLRLEEEARILGRVDNELRPRRVNPELKPAAEFRAERSLLYRKPATGLALCSLLRSSRERSGLTFRSAHDISIKIARALNDKHYAISIGLLSDYEAIGVPPRHIAKIITLCILYGIDFFQYMNCAGIQYDDSSTSRMRMTALVENANRGLACPTGQENPPRFPLTLVAAQNEMSLSRRRVAT